MAQECEFEAITPDEILRDRLVFGIREDRVWERLVREPRLTLAKTDELCCASESMQVQMKVVGNDDISAHAIRVDKHRRSSGPPKSEVPSKPTRDCWNCGRRHQFFKRELCPAYGKKCNKCNKLNHFAAHCRTSVERMISTQDKEVKAIEDNDMDEVFPTLTEVAKVGLDDSQLVTVQDVM